MAFDAYLKIEGVEGEATRKGFEKYIEIYSFSFGVSNPVSIGTGRGGASTGKASLSSFNVMTRMEKSNPTLFQDCCSGKHYPTAEVTLNKSGAESNPFLKYEFVGVYIESLQWSGSSGGDDVPTASLSFAFEKVKMTYQQQDSKGNVGKPVIGSWDVTANVA